MALFGFGKKSIEVANDCCGDAINDICCIKVLGAGCASCHQQYEFVKKAVENMRLPINVEYINDMEKVMEYGVMQLPAIVVNENVISMGKVLKTSEIESFLKKFGD